MAEYFRLLYHEAESKLIAALLETRAGIASVGDRSTEFRSLVLETDAGTRFRSER